MNTTETAHFERFEINLPLQCVADCSHQGECDEDVAAWVKRLAITINPVLIRAELGDYGNWDDHELTDDGANLARIVWMGAGNISEQMGGREAVQAMLDFKIDLPKRCKTFPCALAPGHEGAHMQTTRAGLVVIGGGK